MDCRRRSAVDDDRSRRKRMAVDDDRRRGRWAGDDDRSRIAFYQAQVKASLDQVEKNLRSIRRMRMRSATIPEYSSSSSSASRHPKQFRNQLDVVHDYPPLELPLRWRDPPPEYPPLELPLKWRNPLPDHIVSNYPEVLVRQSPSLRHHSFTHGSTATIEEGKEEKEVVSKTKRPTEVASDGSDDGEEEENRIFLQEINIRSRLQKLPLQSCTACNSASGIAATALADDKKMIEEKKTQLEHVLLHPDTYFGTVEIYQEERVYVPEMIFRHLLTSSNYDATQDLRSIANRMIVTRYGHECFQVYGRVHKFAVELCFRHLGIELMNIGCRALESLDLCGNNLSRTIPLQMGKLSSLILLSLSDIQLVGPLPAEIGICSSLVELELHDNLIGGPIPSQVAKLRNLEKLVFMTGSGSSIRRIGSPEASFLTVCDDLLVLSIAEINAHDMEVCGKAIGSGTGNIFTAGVKISDLKLIAKDDPALCSQAVRCNVTEEFDPKFVISGDEAFEKARRRAVPIFLSIGYSTCHWCHVIEVESFENDEIARRLNEWFVSIKVDREERPDVDKVYMTYVQALYGGGGWPLSVFLSPDLKPLMGGIYFPPDDNYGRPGFKKVLRKVKEAWESKREELEHGGTLAIEQLSNALSASASSKRLTDHISQEVVKLCSEQVASRYDPNFGGFGSAPKFSRPVKIRLMLYESMKLREQGRVNEGNKNMEMVFHTLQCMARGGIHDHLGGGFHRYSVDECWHVQHFDKMLYDQGLLADVSLDAFTVTKEALDSFKEMQEAKVKPSHVTFTNILSACSHVGLVEEGRMHSSQMLPLHGIAPDIEHYGCMVDILGRVGRLEEAMDPRCKVFDPGGFIIIFTFISLPITRLDGVELF